MSKNMDNWNCKTEIIVDGIVDIETDVHNGNVILANLKGEISISLPDKNMKKFKGEIVINNSEYLKIKYEYNKDTGDKNVRIQ